MFVYPWFAGYLNAYCVTLVKSVGNIFATESETHAGFKHLLTYVIFLGLGGSLFVEVLIMNMGMKNFDMSKVTPIFRGSIVINSVLCGGIIYDEFSTFTGL